MKGINFIFLYVLLTLCSVASYAYDFEVEGNYYNVISVADRTVIYAGINFSEYPNEFTIPETVEYEGRVFTIVEIGNSAFAGKAITTVNIPSTIKSVGAEAFANSEIERIDIPETLTSLGNKAFMNCKKLKSVEIPSSVTLGKGVFKGCINLENVKLPNDLTVIKAGTFNGCKSLKDIKLPESLTQIKDENGYQDDRWEYGAAFGGCTSLTHLVIPNNVTWLESNCFSGCSGLEIIDLGEKVGSMGTTSGSWTYFNGGTFSGCNNIGVIISRNPKPPYIPEATNDGGTIKYYECFGGLDKKKVKVYVPKGSIELYQKATEWKEFWNYYPLEEYGNESEEQSSRCIAPTIELIDGKLVVGSSTESAMCKINISSDDIKSVVLYETNSIDLCGVYKITAYAYKDGLEDSDVSTAMIIWTTATLCQDETTSAKSISVNSTPLLISQSEGILTISGLQEGDIISAYSTDGKCVATSKAIGNAALLNLSELQGKVAVLNVAGKSAKITVK